MAVDRRHADRGIRWWGALLIAGAGFAALVALLSALVTLFVARTVVTPPRRRAEDVRVLGVDLAARTITLAAGTESRIPGLYSFWFDGDTGYARLGDIVSMTASTVTRTIEGVDFGNLAGATKGRFSGWVYLDPAELGYPFEDVELPTEFGEAPAWVIPADGGSDRWVIQVHGRAVRRQEALRAVPVFREAGYTSLLVTYRNDGDAPNSPDYRYALGDTEWRDVDVALRYALDHGAKDVVLMGWSMGGATVLQELTRTERAAAIRGLALESPVVDWVRALTYQGEVRRLPTPVIRGVLGLLGTRWGRPFTGQQQPIDLARLDFVRRAAEIDVPILILHSDDDDYIPIEASRELAAERPDIVTFEAFSIAGHTRLWNFDRVRWNSAISQWLKRLEAGTARN